MIRLIDCLIDFINELSLQKIITKAKVVNLMNLKIAFICLFCSPKNRTQRAASAALWRERKYNLGMPVCLYTYPTTTTIIKTMYVYRKGSKLCLCYIAILYLSAEMTKCSICLFTFWFLRYSYPDKNRNNNNNCY